MQCSDKNESNPEENKNNENINSNVNTYVEQNNTENKRLKMLEKCTYENTPELNLDGHMSWAKVVKVYDGDTVHVALFIHNEIRRIVCRLKGIDTAELRSKDPLERAHSLKAKQYLIQMVYNKIIWIQIYKKDKYGRYLIILCQNKKSDWNSSYNCEMLKLGLACEYDGKKKPHFRNWSRDC